MNAMLEPRMVAARIQGRDCSAQGSAGPQDRITASSHGCFIPNLDAYGMRRDSGRFGNNVRSEVPLIDASDIRRGNTDSREALAGTGEISLCLIMAE